MPSVAQAGRGLALGAIAGLGIYRPPADARLARRLTGSDLTGVSYRVQAEQGINTASLAAGAARAALQAGGVHPPALPQLPGGGTPPHTAFPPPPPPGATPLQLAVRASTALPDAGTNP